MLYLPFPLELQFESRIPLSSSGPEIKRGNNRSSNQGPCPRPYWVSSTHKQFNNLISDRLVLVVIGFL